MQNQFNHTQSADAVSAGLSGLCLLHCLALPAIVSLSPIFGVISQEWVHQALVIMAVPVSLSVLSKFQRGPSRIATIFLILGGLSFLIAGAFVEQLHDYEKQLTVMGGLMLAVTHTVRWWTHKRRQYPPEEHL